MDAVRLDEVGYWSELKLDIVKKYAQAYSVIMNAQPLIEAYIYIDAFAGAGVLISKKTREYIPGSPLNALNVKPPFSEYHFIDLDGGRANALQNLCDGYPSVHTEVHEGDCNRLLLTKIFPKAKFSDYRRALCLLDPYGLHLNWEVVRTAGKMESIEVFLNFPVMDMNMNVLWKDSEQVDEAQDARMNAFWGDDSWRKVIYRTAKGLFGDIQEKAGIDPLIQAYRNRLEKVAGFTYVPDPIPMRNSKGATVYYLFFASPNDTGARIVTEIFNKYTDRRLVSWALDLK